MCKTTTVYLLHFSSKLAHAGHYIGSTSADDVETRVDMHRKGQGARITQVAAEQGIELTVVRTWAGDKNFERKLKNQKNAPQLCPVCKAAAKKAKAKAKAKKSRASK